MRYRLITMVFMALCCTACTTMAPDSSQQASSNEWRLQNLESRFLEYQEANKQQKAEMDARLKAMENRLEESSRTAESAKTLAAQSQADVSSLKEAIIAKSMQEMATAEAAAKPTPAPKVATAKPQAKKAAPKSTYKPKPAQRVSKAEVAYQKALGYVRSGNTEKGRKGLDAFLGDYPKSPLVPNALYWLGESYYHEKRYAQAILTFKDVIRRFAKHNKAAASMLKIGFSYEQLGDTSNAKFYLQALVEDYPSSGPASIARKKLASM